MTQWNDLVATALVGAGRVSAKSDSGTAPLDVMLAQLPPEQSPEQRLLSEAGAVALWRHAGAGPYSVTISLPPASAPDETPPCPEAASALLARLLGSDFSAAVSYEHLLPEWLSLLAAHGYALPQRWLPELLNLARQAPELYSCILPLLGERGRWLAAQHPDWQGFLIAADPVAWETADSRSRLGLLKALRRTDPARALALLQTTWKQDRANDRESFLGALEIGLGPDDESLLEAALDDRGKTVRVRAAELLARLPGSALVQRMKQRLAAYLKFQRAADGALTLKVTLPKDCAADMTRDGMNDTPAHGTGKRVWRLMQLIGAVPPSYWVETWQLTPAELVHLADATGDPPGEHAPALLGGWSWAAARYRDTAWAEALLKHWAEKSDVVIAHRLSELVQLIAPDQMDAWLIARLKGFREQIKGAKQVKGNSDALEMLQAYEYPWSEALSREVFMICRDLAAKTLQGTAWNWVSAMSNFAYYIHPSLAAESLADWPDAPYWRSNVETLLAVLHFRQEMQQAF